MSFTISEKIRSELSTQAVIHYRRVKNWTRAYEIARRNLNRTVNSETQTVLAELEINEKKFLENEFLLVQ